MMECMIGNRKLELQRGDITEQETDAIVNAANARLQLGAGVAGAIRSKGGPSIQRECDRIGGTPVGTAVLTGAGDLKARHVIHAVGPRMGEGDEDAKLAAATRSSLEVADEHRLRSIALPAISTGVYGFPLERAATIMLEETIGFLQQPSSLERVVFCLFGEDDFRIFTEQLRKKRSDC